MIKSKVFLDMDGVLVDLYKVITNLARKKSYKELTVDDFFKIMLHKGDVYDFFKTLPEFKSNTVLLDKIMRFTGGAGYYICSTPLHDERESLDSKRNQFFISQSILGKNAWIDEHLHPLPIKRCFTLNKAKDAPAVEKDGTPNILIDDKQKNVDDWIEAGGFAIKFQADEHEFDPNLKFIDKELGKIAKTLKKSNLTYNEAVESYLKKYKGM